MPSTAIVTVPWPSAPATVADTVAGPGNVMFGALTVIAVVIVVGGGGTLQGGGKASADGARTTTSASAAAAVRARVRTSRTARSTAARSNLPGVRTCPRRPETEDTEPAGAGAADRRTARSADRREAMPKCSPAPRHLTGREHVVYPERSAPRPGSATRARGRARHRDVP